MALANDQRSQLEALYAEMAPANLTPLWELLAGLVKPQKLGWVERIIRGGPSRVAIGFHEVRDRPLFPMYLAHRDRVVRLADAPA